jgi:hypothetical protein
LKGRDDLALVLLARAAAARDDERFDFAFSGERETGGRGLVA